MRIRIQAVVFVIILSLAGIAGADSSIACEAEINKVLSLAGKSSLSEGGYRFLKGTSNYSYQGLQSALKPQAEKTRAKSLELRRAETELTSLMKEQLSSENSKSQKRIEELLQQVKTLRAEIAIDYFICDSLTCEHLKKTNPESTQSKEVKKQLERQKIAEALDKMKASAGDPDKVEAILTEISQSVKETHLGVQDPQFPPKGVLVRHRQDVIDINIPFQDRRVGVTIHTKKCEYIRQSGISYSQVVTSKSLGRSFGCYKTKPENIELCKAAEALENGKAPPSPPAFR